MKFILTILIFVIASNIIQSQDIKESLKAHYKFDENLSDETIYDNDLKIDYGKVKYNQVLNEDRSIAVSGGLRISTKGNFDNSKYKEASISIWFKSSIRRSELQIMLQGANMGFGIYLKGKTGKVIGFFDGSSYGSLESKKELTDGKWHNIVLQSDGERTYMYVDGQYDGETKEEMRVGNGWKDNKLYIGKSNLGVQSFVGEINEIRIYDRLLTKDEIEKISKNPKSIKEEEKDNKDDMKIYSCSCPSDIEFKPKENDEYRIYTLEGEQLKEGKGSKVNIEGIEPGLYLIQINAEEKRVIIIGSE